MQKSYWGGDLLYSVRSCIIKTQKESEICVAVRCQTELEDILFNADLISSTEIGEMTKLEKVPLRKMMKNR